MPERDPDTLTDLERTFYGDDIERVAPATPSALAEAAAELVEAKRTVLPAGAGTHAFLGNRMPTPATVLSTERLASVVAYEPDDFTIAVEAGMTLVELRETLAANGQELAADWATGGRDTVGGLVAAGASFAGPRAARLGPLSSQILGVHGVRGAGRRYKVGGMVVKNVAGYDVGKLLCGSLGTAGIIERINLKLCPLPRCRQSGLARFSSRERAWACGLDLRRSPPPLASVSVIDAGRDGGLESLVHASGSVSVVWTLEGGRELVGHGGSVVARSISRADLVDEPDTGDADDATAAIDRISAFREPLDTPLRSQAIAVIARRPSELATVGEEVWAVFESAGIRSRDLLGDIPGGRLWIAWDAPEEQIVSVATRLREIAVGGAGWLIYVPPSLRSRLPYLLHDPPRRDVAGKVLRVFDPGRLYCPGRVLGPGDRTHDEH